MLPRVQKISKDYSTTGVLKRANKGVFNKARNIRKDYPTTGVLKLIIMILAIFFRKEHQEGLPDYWGIETKPARGMPIAKLKTNQEGLPDYWGIGMSAR